MALREVEIAKFGRIKISSRSTHLFGMLRSSTGIGPEPWARMALCISLGQKGTPNPDEYNADGSEFTPEQMFGEDESLYLALMLNRLKADRLISDYLNEMTRAHVNRGAISLKQRVSDLSDVFKLASEFSVEETKTRGSA